MQVFADSTGGAYSVWIDKRAGNIGSLGTTLYAQHLDQVGTALLPANVVALHTVEPDRLASVDYVPVGQPNGSVQVFWSSVGTAPTGQDICAGRMQNSGTLLGTERAAEALGFGVYPQPGGY